MQKGENEREIQSMGLRRVGPQPEFLMITPAALMLNTDYNKKTRPEECKLVGKEVRRGFKSFFD